MIRRKAKRARVNLAQRRLGAEVVFATDEFFAPKERLIDEPAPIFVPDKYDDHGKWMDGWESRRRRDGGHDFCVVRLGRPGLVELVEMDTTHFTGNFPPGASLDGIYSPDAEPNYQADWDPLVGEIELQGDSKHMVGINDPGPWTHLKLHIYPDGGMARLRVYGRCFREWDRVDANEGLLDLAAIENGGVAIACNDEHFGRLSNILAPGRGFNMGDGWETRRRREPGHDWAVIELGHPGVIQQINIDTAFFKGNYPDRCSIQGAYVDGLQLDTLEQDSLDWSVVLPEQTMEADYEHIFGDEILSHEPVSHLRLNMIPDGGISRLRVFGRRHT